MRMITEHIPAKTTTAYQCAKCKTKYRSKIKALECEELPVENKYFEIGEKIILIGWWSCMKRLKNSKKHEIRSFIEKINGPFIFDSEIRRLAFGKLDGKHMFEYDVWWYCKNCRCRHYYCAYSFELKKIKTR